MASNRLVPWHRRFPTPSPLVGDLQQQINRLFDDVWSGHPTEPSSEGLAQLTPSIDVSETDDAFHIEAELPGADEKDIDVTLSDGVLSLKGEKKFESEQKGKNAIVKERRYGSFFRSFRLPPEADVDGIQAKFEKGVLHVTVPKKPEAKQTTKQIEIKSS